MVRAWFTVTTPLFMGGALPEERLEIRPPSVRGTCRFWFRAMKLNAFAEEDRLFGSTRSQGLVATRVVSRVQTVQAGEELWGSADAYLAYGLVRAVSVRRAPGSPPGQGARSSRMEIRSTRPYGKPGGTLEVHCHFKPEASEDDRVQVSRALWLLGTLGGLGARSRRGLGSVSLERLEGPGVAPPAADPEALKNQLVRNLTAWCCPLKPSLPDYTAVSGLTRVLVGSRVRRDWRSALTDIGTRLKDHRSYLAPSRHYADDHDLVLGYLQGRRPSTPPARAIFGLPHNYYFRRTGQKAGISAESLKRRGSPLLIHIHRYPGDQWGWVVSFLPATFLPPGVKLCFTGERGPVHVDPGGWEPIHRFLGELKGESLEVNLA
ncbi:MAG: RAMP superfamily CRISPR-associated protein [bacterium]|nr:RAMP superfamily CRISPR-associated protein [bacterium]